MTDSKPHASAHQIRIEVAAAIILVAVLFLVHRELTRPSVPTVSFARPGVSAKPNASASDPTAEFTGIYEAGLWGQNAEGKGNSGSGSTVEATVVYRAYLQQFLKQYDIRSVVDAGCGDWEFSQTMDWSGIDYMGFDIVESVIEKNKKKFGSEKVKFFTANIVTFDLPPADLLIVKHVLQHLPTADVQIFLKQLPKFKHVLLVNGVDADTLTSDNADILPGRYRPLDLTRPPFNLPAKKELIYFDELHGHEVLHLARR